MDPEQVLIEAEKAKKLIKLREMFLENPPEGITAGQIRRMTYNALQDLYSILTKKNYLNDESENALGNLHLILTKKSYLNDETRKALQDLLFVLTH